MVLRIFCLLPRHEVDFGVGDFSVPAKSTHVVEHRHAEIEADVLAGLALLTTAAAVIEWDSNAVTSFEARDVRAHFFNNAAKLMTENGRGLGGDP